MTKTVSTGFPFLLWIYAVIPLTETPGLFFANTKSICKIQSKRQQGDSRIFGNMLM